MYKAVKKKSVRVGRGTTKDYPDVPGIAQATWRWIDESRGFFETKSPMTGVSKAPATYEGVFARPIERATGKVIKGAVAIHDNEHGCLAIVGPAGTFIHGPDCALERCNEGDTDAVQIHPKVPVTPSDNDEGWAEGIPKELTVAEMVPEVAGLSDDELKEVLRARGVSI
jgi:hypothetical protein